MINKIRECKECKKIFQSSLLNKMYVYCSLDCKKKHYRKIDLSRLIKIKDKNKEFINKYKKDKICKNCGYNDNPNILQFHHRNINEKNNGINALMKRLGKLEEIKEEIKKCDLLCPNCHFNLHYQNKGVINTINK